MIDVNNRQTVAFWQTPKADDEIGEPAIIFTKYSDVLEVKQEGRYVQVNLSCVPEFIKALKLAMEQKP